VVIITKVRFMFHFLFVSLLTLSLVSGEIKFDHVITSWDGFLCVRNRHRWCARKTISHFNGPCLRELAAKLLNSQLVSYMLKGWRAQQFVSFIRSPIVRSYMRFINDTILCLISINIINLWNDSKYTQNYYVHYIIPIWYAMIYNNICIYKKN